MRIRKNDLIFTIISGLILGLIVGSIILILSEIGEAQTFCNSINENYSYDSWKMSHKCNDVQINKYHSGLMGRYWDFNPRENFNITLP